MQSDVPGANVGNIVRCKFRKGKGMIDTYFEDCFCEDGEYYEPSEAEAKMQEITDMLKGAVKQEIKDELERLRKENAELRQYKDKFQENNEKVGQELRNLRFEKEKLERTVKQARIRELLGEYIVAGWVVQRVYSEKPKCDKCNEKRELVYYSPRGKEMRESCECSESTLSYRVQTTELIRVEIRKEWDSIKWCRTYFTAPTIWKDGKEVEDSIERTSHVYNDEAFEKIAESYLATRYVFLDEEKCKEFCEYLNKK